MLLPDNVKRPNFIALPEPFDKINDEVEDYVDQIAERAVELGGAAEGTARMGEPNMSFGTTVFTFVHVVLSLVGICSGLVVLGGLFAAKRFDRWTVLFLVSTVATSVTGLPRRARGGLRDRRESYD